MIKTITLDPSRIGCPSIPGTMKGIILSIPGVKDVRVRYEERSLDVTFDDAQVSEEEIMAQVGKEMGLSIKPSQPGAKKPGSAAETCPM